AEGHPGRGHSNRYRMSNAARNKGSIRGPFRAEKGSICDSERVHSCGPEPSIEQSMVRDAKASPHRGESRSRSLASPPGARSPVGGALVQEVKQEVIAP